MEPGSPTKSSDTILPSTIVDFSAEVPLNVIRAPVVTVPPVNPNAKILPNLPIKDMTRSTSMDMNSRSPKCAQCYNHGKLVLLKNHKRYCPWINCQCYKCCITYERRRVMASQIAVRRAQSQDMARARDMVVLNEEVKQIHRHSSEIKDRNAQPKHKKLEASLPTRSNSILCRFDWEEEISTVPEKYRNFGLQPPGTMRAIDEMRVSLKALVDVFSLPPSADFLIYRILKDNHGDLKQTSVKIFEAQCELRSWELLRETVREVNSVNSECRIYK